MYINKTNVSEIIRKPPIVKAQNAVGIEFQGTNNGFF